MKTTSSLPCPRGHRTPDDLAFELAELLELGILSPEDIQSMPEAV